MKSEKVVAIIDDDPTMLKALGRLLKVHGFRSQTFASAEAFLNHHGQNGVACLLLDIHLGRMSGIELGRQLKALGRQVPIVFITANDDEATRREAMDVGYIAFLRKPFSAKVLIDAIAEVMG